MLHFVLDRKSNIKQIAYYAIMKINKDSKQKNLAVEEKIFKDNVGIFLS